MKKLFVLGFLSCAMWACGNSEAGSDEMSSEENISEASESTSKSCLSQYIDDPCQLITAQVVAELFGATEAELEIEAMEGLDHMECSYTWPSDRESKLTMESGGRKIETTVPADNKFFIREMDIIDEEKLEMTRTDSYTAYFQRVYGVKTDAEKKEIRNAIDRAVEGSDQVDKDAGKTLKGISDKQNKKVVDNLGDQAVASVMSLKNYSNYSFTELYVLHDNVVIHIESDISQDNNEDLDAAKKVAQHILNQCD